MNMNEIIEHLHTVIEDRYPLGWDSKNHKIRASTARLLNLVEESYVHVEWPASQQYMEQDWFEEEAVLDVNSPTGSSYFIPLARAFEFQD